MSGKAIFKISWWDKSRDRLVILTESAKTEREAFSELLHFTHSTAPLLPHCHACGQRENQLQNTLNFVNKTTHFKDSFRWLKIIFIFSDCIGRIPCLVLTSSVTEHL